MRKHSYTIVNLAGIALLGVAMAARAQTPANDPSARLKQVLSPDVSTRVLAVIAKAAYRELNLYRVKSDR